MVWREARIQVERFQPKLQPIRKPQPRRLLHGRGLTNRITLLDRRTSAERFKLKLLAGNPTLGHFFHRRHPTRHGMCPFDQERRYNAISSPKRSQTLRVCDFIRFSSEIGKNCRAKSDRIYFANQKDHKL
jgi:hypothetical protein